MHPGAPSSESVSAVTVGNITVFTWRACETALAGQIVENCHEFYLGPSVTRVIGVKGKSDIS